MKNKMFLVMSLLLISSLLLSACGSTATPTQAAPVDSPPTAPANTAEAPKSTDSATPPVIKIGAIYPLTGALAINGQQQIPMHQFAIDQINEQGGIKCLGGAKLEMIYGDHEAKVELGNAETERLITQEGVIAIMGPYDSGIALTTTEIAEKYEVPYMVSAAVAKKIVTRGLKYTFMISAPTDRYAEAAVAMAVEKGAKDVVTLAPNNTYGETFDGDVTNAIKATTLNQTPTVFYSAGGSDFTDVVMNLKTINPEVIFLIGDTSDVVLLYRQLKELDFWPKMAIISLASGTVDPGFLDSVGPLAEGLFTTVDWYPSLNEETKVINAEYKAVNGVEMTANPGTYAGTWLLAAALEKSCSTDPKKLAETLRTTRFEEGPWNMIYPYVKFDETGLNETSIGIVGQYQDGVQVPVYPAEYAVKEMVWPVPPWSER